MELCEGIERVRCREKNRTRFCEIIIDILQLRISVSDVWRKP